MPTTTSYPTSGEFRELERNLVAEMSMADPIFRHFPIRDRNTWMVTWRQKDDFTGTQQPRGINGEPPRVVPLGENFFTSQPGVYGEYMPIDERSLTMRADLPMGGVGLPMPTRDMIAEVQEQLLHRRMTRIKNTCWELIVQGYFVVRDIKNAVIHTDAYTQLQYTASVGWATPATSTPLADFRAAALLGRGSSVNFGGGSVAYANQVTVNRMMTNTNAADLGGKRVGGGNTVTSLNGWNTILQGEGLPTVQVYDEGYFTEAGVFTFRFPDNVVILVGTRPGNGQKVGEYSMVINANNPNRAPGPYTIVADSADGPHPVPREIHVHDGHNGGPALEYPGQILRMNV